MKESFLYLAKIQMKRPDDLMKGLLSPVCQCFTSGSC